MDQWKTRWWNIQRERLICASRCFCSVMFNRFTFSHASYLQQLNATIQNPGAFQPLLADANVVTHEGCSWCSIVLHLKKSQTTTSRIASSGTLLVYLEWIMLKLVQIVLASGRKARERWWNLQAKAVSDTHQGWRRMHSFCIRTVYVVHYCAPHFSESHTAYDFNNAGTGDWEGGLQCL